MVYEVVASLRRRQANVNHVLVVGEVDCYQLVPEVRGR